MIKQQSHHTKNKLPARLGLKTKSGLASFYIVTFVTLVLSVVVLSFVRIVVIDANRTSNDDLYQSAYDSALAGVEDARAALVKYQECKGKDTRECNTLRGYIENGENDCDSIAHALGRIDSSASEEVPISETTSSSSYSDSSLSMDQAYTCVTVNLRTPDYRGTLTSNNRVMLVPIRTQGNASDVKSIRISWLSDAIKEKGKNYIYPNTYSTDNNGGNHTYFYSADDKNTYYPPIAVDLFQTNDTFTLGELTTNNRGTDHSSFVLQPASNGDHNISAADVLNQNDKYNNFPEATKCENGGDFNCYTTIELPGPYNGGNRNNDTFFLRLESPYAQAPIDFSVTLIGNNNQPIDFYGVQAHVDSTGRANDLVRRVETRIDFLTDFPYPEFAIQLNPDQSEVDSLTKNFYVSRNCWYTDDSNKDNSYSDDLKNDKNIVLDCEDTGDASNYSAF